MCWEWFIKVWYIVDNDRHVTPVNMYSVDGESNEIGAREPGASAGKVLLDIPLAEQGRDEVGIDVDRLVVDVRPTTERSVSRA